MRLAYDLFICMEGSQRYIVFVEEWELVENLASVLIARSFKCSWIEAQQSLG